MAFSRERINPIEFMLRNWPDLDLSHITYDPDMKESDRDYWIIRQGGHDGTMLFTFQMLGDSISNIANMQSFKKSSEPEDWSRVKRIEYLIGPMRLSTAYGMVELKCGRFPGQKERVRIAVKAKIIYKEKG